MLEETNKDNKSIEIKKVGGSNKEKNIGEH